MSGDEVTLIFFSSTVIILLMVVFIIAFIVRYQRKLLHQQEQLATQRIGYEQQLQQAILDGQEQERGRIAAELHDNLGSLLAAIRLKVLRKSGAEHRQNAEEVGAMLTHGMNAVRSVCHDLMPVSLRSFGLGVALKELAAQFEEVEGLSVQFVSLGEEIRLADKTALAVYRIVQELLSNGLRHAKASQIAWTLHWQQNSLTFQYADDGIGFDPEQISRGLGLTNLSVRVALLQGEWKIDSEPGRGTQVSIAIPLNRL